MMKKNITVKLIIIVGILTILFFVWRQYRLRRPSYSPEINKVLFMAGENRSELEKVLKHYAKNPVDSLKLRAAEFLIANMAGRHSKYYEAPWNDVASVFLRWTSSSNKQRVIDAYQLGTPVIKDDVEYISAKYLIDNIELAFHVWREQPWGRHVLFDTFCEEILPYRVDTEPLENWREKALASFADVYNALKSDSSMTAVEACARVNKIMPKFEQDIDFPQMSFSMLMASRKGSCEKQTAYGIFVMRALGIPVSYEYTPAWYNNRVGHAWNAVSDSLGRHISFVTTESAPGEPHPGLISTTTKIYRQTFAVQDSSRHKPENTLWEANSRRTRDVSLEYPNYREVKISIRFPCAGSKDIYLSSMGIREWNIVGWCYPVSGERAFSIRKNVLYLPVHLVNGKKMPSNYPFMVNDNDSLRLFCSDTVRCAVTIDGISPINPMWVALMRNGVFEGANKPDFSDAKLLYHIKDKPLDKFNSAKPETAQAFRYVRYHAPKGKTTGYNLAEIKLYDAKGLLLKGSPIINPERADKLNVAGNVFDNDVTSFYESTHNNAWIGLDLGIPQTIGEIRYLPRSYDNLGIYESHVYELFRWDIVQGWISFDIKEATAEPLQYQIPVNALLYLKNKTLEKTGAVFTVHNSIQKFL